MPPEQLVDLVLEGGGAKGLATPGAVIRLLEAGYTFPRIAGTSAGALTAAVVAAVQRVEHTPERRVRRLREILDRLDTARIPDSSVPYAPLLDLVAFPITTGVYRGDYIRNFLHTELKALGVETFGDLRRHDDGDDAGLPADQHYSLVVMATDVTHGRQLRLPWDYRRAFDEDPDEQLVADAVRMSISIPFYFTPRTLTDRRTGEHSTIVDGGVLSNFPVDAFDRTDGRKERWKTVGIRVFPDLPQGLGGVLPVRPSQILRVPALRLLEEVVATTIVGHDQTHLERPEVRERTITIDSSGVQITQFDLSEGQREDLLAAGWRAADDFLHRRGP